MSQSISQIYGSKDGSFAATIVSKKAWSFRGWRGRRLSTKLPGWRDGRDCQARQAGAKTTAWCLEEWKDVILSLTTDEGRKATSTKGSRTDGEDERASPPVRHHKLTMVGLQTQQDGVNRLKNAIRWQCRRLHMEIPDFGEPT